MAGNTGSVGLQWTIGSVANVLYTGSQGSTVTLTITNGTSAAIKLAKGAVPPLGFYAGSLLVPTSSTPGCPTPGWTLTMSAGDTLGLAPSGSAPVEIAPQQPLALTLTRMIAVSGVPSQAISVDLNYLTNSGAAAKVTACITLTLTSAPPTGLKALQATVGLVADRITANQSQTLRLFLANGAGTPLTWAGGAPTFTVTLPSGTGAADLTGPGTTPTLAVAPGIGPASAWQVTPGTTSGAMTWTVQPTASTTLGTGSQATTVFEIDGIIADMSGVADVTFAYDEFSGYAGDTINMAAEKQPLPPPAPTIVASATPDAIDLRSGPGTVVLNYTTTNATSIAILGVGIFAVDSSGSGSVSVDLVESTLFTLVASNGAGQSATASLTVTVSPSLFEMLPVGSVVMWSGTPGIQPEGWAPCTADGGAGVPNLADSFILGAESGSGLTPMTPAPHTHGVASFSGSTGNSNYNGVPTHTHTVGAISWSNWSSCWRKFSINQTGTHTHSAPTASLATGAAGPLNPKGMAMVYLVKQW